jgi:hypothetical protein
LTNNVHQLVLESHFEETIGLIEDEDFHIFEGETLCVLNVINETTSCGDDNIGAFETDLSFLILDGRTTENS